MKKKIISVVSGKGGVGKSTIVSLIGLALKRKNNKVLLIDADIGLSNLELILHTEKSPYDLEDVLNGEIEIDSVYNYLDKNLAIVNLYNHISINEFDEEKVLNIFPRSGLGFKFRLQMNNTVGIIDSDYFYSDNEGHIFVKLTNDTNEGKTVSVAQGTGMVQGIFMQYGVTIDDDATEVRNGGFGSTTK